MVLKNGFYWGNSVSSMQTEGAWDEGGKGKSVYDIREASEFASDWKVATDSYHRYKEDFDYMQDLGMNMYRFQISWSRVNPDGDGEFNEEGITFYDQFIDDLIERGIEPMICLYHFDMPLNLAEKYNGFLSREVTDAFARYGIEMVKRFGHKVKHWITFNEQNLYHDSTAFRRAGYLNGEETLNELYQISHHVMMAHAYVANYIHENTDCKISGMLAYREVYPASSHPKDIFIAREIDEHLNNNLLEVFVNGKYLNSFWKFIENNNINLKIRDDDLEVLSKVTSDYLTFSYYASFVVSHQNIPEGTAPNFYMDKGVVDNNYLEATDIWNWQIDPLGFRNILNKIYARYRLPVFPIENGIGIVEEWDGVHPIQDDYRIEYHHDHIQAMIDAVELDGVEVLGYLGWAMIDILSSKGDMRKRYGVVYVNRENHDLKDLKRVPKKSYEWLKKAIHSNGNDLK